MNINPVFLNILQKSDQTDIASNPILQNPEFLFADLIKLIEPGLSDSQNDSFIYPGEDHEMTKPSEINLLPAVVSINNQKATDLISFFTNFVSENLNEPKPAVNIISGMELSRIVSDITVENPTQQTNEALTGFESAKEPAKSGTESLMQLIDTGKPVILKTASNPQTEIVIQKHELNADNSSENISGSRITAPPANLLLYKGFVFNKESLGSVVMSKMPLIPNHHPGKSGSDQNLSANPVQHNSESGKVKFNFPVFSKTIFSEFDNEPDIKPIISENNPQTPTGKKYTEQIKIIPDKIETEQVSRIVKDNLSLEAKPEKNLYKVFIRQISDHSITHNRLKIVEESFPKIKPNRLEVEEHKYKSIPVNKIQFSELKIVKIDNGIAANEIHKSEQPVSSGSDYNIDKPEIPAHVHTNLSEPENQHHPVLRDSTAINSASFKSKEQHPVSDLENIDIVRVPVSESHIKHVNNSAPLNNSEFISGKTTPKIIHIKDIEPEITKIIEKGVSSSLELQLIPKELGKVKVIIESINKIISLKIEVENEAAKEALQINLHNLSQRFSTDNLVLNSININVMTKDNRHEVQIQQRKKNYKPDNQERENLIPAVPKNLGYNTYDYII